MSNQIACPEPDVLSQALLGQLPEVEAEAVEQHLLHCELCLKNTAVFGASDTLIAAIRERPAAEREQAGLTDVVARLKERLRAQPAAGLDSGATPTIMLGSGAEFTIPASNESAAGVHPANESASLLRPAQGPDELGRLGPFRVLKLLGRGGMGAVFEAEDLQLKRRVALKVVHPSMSHNATVAERFLREAQTAASLHHDHIVTIFQVGQDGTTPFMAMELLAGESLDDRLRRKHKVSPADAIRIGREIAEGLAAAHARGVLHRDIKPANIWLEERHRKERVKLLDFGLARQSTADVKLTQEGMALGTPGYMSPEQASGQELDQRADLFSLGCVVYEMCTGKLPFQGKTLLNMLNALANHTPEDPATLDAAVPGELSALIMRLLSKQREQRPASAAEVVEALTQLERQPEPMVEPPKAQAAAGGTGKTKRLIWIASAAAALILLCGVIVIVRNKFGEEIGRIVVPEKGTIDLESDDGKKPPVEPAPAGPKTPASKFPPGARAKIVPGQPLESAALVSRPAKIEGVQSWTIETVGHRYPISQLACSPRGTWLATADARGTIRIWEQATQRLQQVVLGQYGGAVDLAWSPDEKLLAVADASPEPVSIVEVSSGRRRTLGTQKKGIESLSWSPNEPILIGTAGDYSLAWNTMTWEAEPFESLGRFVRHSPAGDRLAGILADNTLRIWDAKSREVVAKCPDIPSRDYSHGRHLAWSPDGETVAVGSEAGEKAVWCVAGATGKLRFENQDAPDGAVQRGNVAWSPTGEQLVVAYQVPYKWGVQLLDAQTGKSRATIAGPGSGLATALGWSPDGKTIYAGGEWIPALVLFDADERQVRQTLTGAEGNQVNAVTWTAGPGETIVLDPLYGYAALEAATGKPLALGRPDGVEQLVVGRSLDGKWAISRDGGVYRQEQPAKLPELKFSVEFPAHKQVKVTLSRDNKTIVVANCPEHKIDLFEADAGKAIRTLDLGDHLIGSIALSVDEKTIAVGRADGTVQLWVVADSELIKSIPTDYGASALAYSEDGQFLAAGSPAGGIQVWTADGEKSIAKFPAHFGAVTALRFSPDSKTLLSGGFDGLARAWNPRTGEPRGTLVYIDSERALTISPAGHYRGKPDRIDRDIVYVVQTDAGQQTLTPAEFAEKYDWKNDPEQVKLQSP